MSELLQPKSLGCMILHILQAKKSLSLKGGGPAKTWPPLWTACPAAPSRSTSSCS